MSDPRLLGVLERIAHALERHVELLRELAGKPTDDGLT